MISPQISHNKKGKPNNKNLSEMIDARYQTLLMDLHQVYLLDEIFASRKAALLRYMNFDYRTRNRFSHRNQFVIQRTILEQEDSTFRMWLRAIPNHNLHYVNDVEEKYYPYDILQTLNTPPYGKQTNQIDWNYPLSVKLFTYENQLNLLKETAQ